MWFLKKKILIAFAFLFLLTSGYFYNNKALDFRFVDEEDNFAIGKYLAKGEMLYDDILTNHQPLTYIFSAFIHKFTNPNSVYVLITRHRQFEIIWSTAWSLLLIFYFGLGAFIAVFIFELTKIYLLGNLFLSEAQTIYPLLIITGLAVFSYKRRLKSLELILLGICFGIVLLMLSPLWPALTLLLIFLLLKQRENLLHTMGYILVGLLLPVSILFKFTSFPGYLNYIFSINLTYTIPSYHNESWIISISKALLTPVLALFSQDIGPMAIIIKLLGVLLIVNIVFLVFKKQLLLAISILILLGLCNIRFIFPGTQGYEGFHLLPWYAMLVFIVSILSVELFWKSNIILKVLNPLVIILLVGLSINFLQADLFQKKNMTDSYNINYSTVINRGDAVKVMKEAGDTLFVSPNAWMIYWQGDIDHLPKLYGYYTWMSGVPEIHSAVLDAFSKNPPTFFYCENCKGLDLEKFLSGYIEIKNNGNLSMLYVLKSKIPRLTKEQLAQLSFYGFSIN